MRIINRKRGPKDLKNMTSVLFYVTSFNLNFIMSWTFSQCFGSSVENPEASDSENILDLCYNDSGTLLAVGDQCGRIVLFKCHERAVKGKSITKLIYRDEIFAAE